jgi:putative FmdB family regulatory protein
VPTYEYRCKGCGEHLEVVQAFTDDALTECPACGGVLKKVFGSIGITFKGSGFYKTDSRSSSSRSSPKEQKEQKEQKDSTSSESGTSSSTPSGDATSGGGGKGSTAPSSSTT